MATTKARVATVQARGIDQLASGINAAIETLEGASFVPQRVDLRDVPDAQGNPVTEALIHAVHETYLPTSEAIIGDRVYAHEFAVTDGEQITESIDALDTELRRVVLSTVEALYTNAADSAAVGTDTDEHDFDKTYTVPAGNCLVGDFLEIDFSVLVSGNMAGGGDVTIKLYAGTQTLATIVGTGVIQDDTISGRLRLRFRAGNDLVVEQDSLVGGIVAGFTAKHARTTGLTLDPASAFVVKASADFSVANAGNTCKLTELTVRSAHIN